MKTLYLPLITILLFVSSCKKDGIVKENDLNKSYQTWLSYKSNIHNSYSYTQYYGSVFGYGTEIKTGIKDGKFISRDLVLIRYHSDGSNKKDTLKQWHEDATNLNTHGIEAGDLLTIDDIYERSRTVWLKADTKSNQVIFEANNKGVISSCGYIPNGCQDDCFNGIKITSIIPL
ncbi:MAG: hypothetical protein AAGC65_17460 [Mucilaginibacter sp.]|uniref:hypothetical protein n=1 Tax=Mucilaginibacter sp. TaxID=1882438 RepID=UPI0031A9BF5B